MPSSSSPDVAACGAGTYFSTTRSGGVCAWMHDAATGRDAAVLASPFAPALPPASPRKGSRKQPDVLVNVGRPHHAVLLRRGGAEDGGDCAVLLRVDRTVAADGSRSAELVVAGRSSGGAAVLWAACRRISKVATVELLSFPVLMSVWSLQEVSVVVTVEQRGDDRLQIAAYTLSSSRLAAASAPLLLARVGGALLPRDTPIALETALLLPSGRSVWCAWRVEEAVVWRLYAWQSLPELAAGRVEEVAAAALPPSYVSFLCCLHVCMYFKRTKYSWMVWPTELGNCLPLRRPHRPE